MTIDTSLVYCHYSLNDTSLLSSGFADFLAGRGAASHQMSDHVNS